MMRRFIPLLALVCVFAVGEAQDLPSAALSDTSAAATDTSRAAGVDTVVVYTAKDSIVYSLRTRYMKLYGQGKTNYQRMTLTAERIDVNWDTATMTAVGVADTIKADSVIGRPIIVDAGEEYHGEKVAYNFRSRKGRITVGTTEIDQGYYRGEQIKKVDVNVLYVADGRYTTCDLDHPHFYFYSPKMKLYVRDKVVAEPVYFYVADVPVFALPFGVFPSRGGRASGIIAPAFGEDGRSGSYLSHLGYYWALSNYFDFATSFDLSTRGGWANRSRLNYGLRYNFTGALDGEYRRVISGQPGDPEYTSSTAYDVSLRHNQVVDPSSRIDVNFRFSSGNFRDYSRNLQDILAQNIYSAASFVKTWERSNRSLAVSVTRDQSLTNGDVGEVFPSISFSQSQIFPFRSRTRSRGLTYADDANRPWLELLGMNYGAYFLNNRAKRSTQLVSAPLFSTTTAKSITAFSRGSEQALTQNLGFSISPKVGVVTITPSLSFSDQRRWRSDHLPFLRSADSSVGYRDTSYSSAVGNMSTGVSLSTRFFGLAQPNLFGVQALRHAVNPTVSLTYNKQIYGLNMPKYQMLGAVNVGNNFEMKVKTSDTTEPQKVQLMNIGLGFTYDFARDSMNFSEVGVNYRTDIGQYLNISGGLAYNLYKFDPVIGRRVNTFLLSDAGKFGDLTNVSLSVSTSLRGEKKQASAANQSIPANVQNEQNRLQGTGLTPPPRNVYQTIYDREEADFSIPWSLMLSYTFSQSRPDPRTYFRMSSANASLSFNLTDLWQVGTTASYDFVSKKHFIPSVDVTRDLHCWTMKFTWYPMGIREGYHLEIKVKAPQLQDIKVTKQNSQRGIYY